MRYLDLAGPDPVTSLALDEALLLEAEEGRGGEVLRLWEWPTPVVVLGSACRIAEDVHVEACRADGVPILRRSSGGGTVLWGRGCLLYSLIPRLDRAAPLAEIRPSYAWILGEIAQALGVQGLGQEGISDLALAGRKLSGNAQQRKRSHLLHHGTLLHGLDLDLVERYLRPPPRQPEYRAGRPHHSFLCQLPLTAREISARLRAHFRVRDEAPPWPEETLRKLRREKYDDPAWITRL